MQTSLVRSILFIAVAGCAGGAQWTYSGEVAAPDLVVISPGVQVIADADEPIFFSESFYWRNEGGYWYRSSYRNRGWARVQVAPVAIRSIERPSAYVHYHASVANTRPTASPEIRDHREVVTPQRREVRPQPQERKDDRKDNKDDRKNNKDKDKHHD